MTGKSNINDMYLWNNTKQSKYSDIEEFVKYHEYDDELIEFENKLKRQDAKMYLIYKYRFKENKRFSEISETLQIPTNRLTDELDKIAFSLRIYCKI